MVFVQESSISFLSVRFLSVVEIRLFLQAQYKTWTGLDWTVGLDSWTGQLDWTVGLDSWTGQLDWTIGLGFFSIKQTQFDVFEESEMIIFKLLCISASMSAMYNGLIRESRSYICQRQFSKNVINIVNKYNSQ